MSTVYITSAGGTLRSANKCLVLEKTDGTKSIIHPHEVTQLVIEGATDLTSGAIGLLMRHPIQTVLMAKNGRFRTALSSAPGKNVAVRLSQYRRIEEPKFALKWSQSIVKAKLTNQLHYLQRVSRDGATDRDAAVRAISEIKTTIGRVERSTTVASIRGHEGYAAREYWRAFGANLKADWAVFAGRRMNPPADNVNAVLSFLYTLVLYRVESAILTEQLDPYLGYLHGLGFGQQGLVYDLMEQFRTPIADALASRLLNLGILSPDDFREESIERIPEDTAAATVEEENSTSESFEEAQAVLLTKDGVKKVIAQFEKKLSTKLYVAALGRRVSYRKAMCEFVHLARSFIEGDTSVLDLLVLK